MLTRRSATADPRKDTLPEDSTLWHFLLTCAYDSDPSGPKTLYEHVHGARCLGARLVRNGTTLRIEPPDPASDGYAECRRIFVHHRDQLEQWLKRGMRVR